VIERIEHTQWEYLPGLLDLMEEGLEPDEVATREFIAPQLRGPGPTTGDLDPVKRRRLDQVWTWLRGFRLDGAVPPERVSVWVPIAQVWPAPGGSVEFAYETTAERQLQAEITVCSVAGLGGGSRRTLGTAVRLTGGPAGVAYETRAFLLVRRYVHSDGRTLDRVDVDCSNQMGEFRPRDLAPQTHPLPDGTSSLSRLRGAGYVVNRIERCSARHENTELRVREESLRSWRFQPRLELPMITSSSLTLGVTCQRTRGFETTFVLPGGHDYAFCARGGEVPVVPVCVLLIAEGDSHA
jgi:hypothetical protein